MTRDTPLERAEPMTARERARWSNLARQATKAKRAQLEHELTESPNALHTLSKLLMFLEDDIEAALTAARAAGYEAGMRDLADQIDDKPDGAIINAGQVIAQLRMYESRPAMLGRIQQLEDCLNVLSRHAENVAEACSLPLTPSRSMEEKDDG